MNDDLQRALVLIVIEHWRILRSFERLVERLPEEIRKRAGAEVRYCQSKLQSILEDLGGAIKTFDGEAFTAALPVSPVGEVREELDRPLTVGSTIEPTVLIDGKVVHIGRVTLL